MLLFYFLNSSQSNTYTCFQPIFVQQTFDWESGEIFSFCIRQWTTGIHHDIKGFGRTELNTDLRSAALLGHCRDKILFRNGIRNQCFDSNLGWWNEWNYWRRCLLAAGLAEKYSLKIFRSAVDPVETCSCLCLYMLCWFCEPSQFIYWPLGILTAVTWRRPALYYSNLECYCHWPFSEATTRRKAHVGCDEWHSFGMVDFKDIRHGQSPLTSASCWRWQTRLGFLSMPGILFTLSFLEFWKASEPPTQNRRA